MSYPPGNDSANADSTVTREVRESDCKAGFTGVGVYSRCGSRAWR